MSPGVFEVFSAYPQGTNISHLGKGKIIFKSALGRDIWVPRRNIYKPPGMYKDPVNDSQRKSGKTPKSCVSGWICIKLHEIWDIPLKKLTFDFLNVKHILSKYLEVAHLGKCHGFGLELVVHFHSLWGQVITDHLGLPRWQISPKCLDSWRLAQCRTYPPGNYLPWK